MGNRHGNPALCVAFFSSCLFLLSRPCRHLAGRPFFLEGGLDFCSPTFLSSSRSLASTLQALYLISFVTLLSPTPFLKFSLVRPLCRQKIGFFCQKKKKGNIFLGACVGLHARRQDDDKRAFDADDEPQRKNRKRPRKTTSPQKKDALFSCLDLSWFFPASKCLVLSRFFHRYILVRRKKLRRDFGSCCRRARASRPMSCCRRVILLTLQQTRSVRCSCRACRFVAVAFSPSLGSRALLASPFPFGFSSPFPLLLQKVALKKGRPPFAVGGVGALGRPSVASRALLRRLYKNTPKFFLWGRFATTSRLSVSPLCRQSGVAVIIVVALADETMPSRTRPLSTTKMTTKDAYRVRPPTTRRRRRQRPQRWTTATTAKPSPR
ncbi:hypothetical protein pqer_cds_1179 [Pandoravirus quercus]|uniref:Uncharacterized protein n=1 Tax=Pandoravirus quercus TaxID=2107709 RepID=A0A2U7UAX3_9VIRU|nr:hypothetical protein pqer_cds_20 [Pandoravirus quercus]YP_009483870.1 hypothetical protein pqer_cds_1179 [Pandoravirus quercus]AVK74442.1 hypothetical protein pqer_cds_20 [Pandoravirus quercus]AVK75601.1 hypothetical protein pqer_cds_1179 [Pandoravirus quercus]